MGQTETGKALLAKVPIREVIAADLRDYEELASWGLEKFYAKN